MTTGEINDPYGSYNFLVEIDGITRAAFQQVGGLDSTIDIVEHREGGALTMRKLPGMVRYSNLQLRWGIADDTQIYAWHLKAAQGEVERKNGSIVLLDRRGQEVARWNFVRAWPCKYDGPDLNSETSDVAIDMIELAHEGVARA